eukprot:3415053-Prymnesium_polylepis.1
MSACARRRGGHAKHFARPVLSCRDNLQLEKPLDDGQGQHQDVPRERQREAVGQLEHEALEGDDESDDLVEHRLVWVERQLYARDVLDPPLLRQQAEEGLSEEAAAAQGRVEGRDDHLKVPRCRARREAIAHRSFRRVATHTI